MRDVKLRLRIGGNCLPDSKFHPQAVFGPQGEAWAGCYRMAGQRAQPKHLRDGCEQQRGFHHGECGTDALPGPASEWKVGKARKFLCAISEPTVGIEFFRI